jgi:hypothetical protein
LKTVSHEAFNNTVRFINGFPAFLLAMLLAKASLEGIHEGWELHPTFCAPHLPHRMLKDEHSCDFNPLGELLSEHISSLYF